MYPYDNNGQATGGLLGMWGGQPAPKICPWLTWFLAIPASLPV